MTAEEASDSWPRLVLLEEHATAQDGVLFCNIICSPAHRELPDER